MKRRSAKTCLGLATALALATMSSTAMAALGLEDCNWAVTASGPGVVVGDFEGTGGKVTVDTDDDPPLNIDAVIQDMDPQPEAPWLVIRLRNYDRSRLTDPTFISEINFALPGIAAMETGSFNRVWGNFSAGPNRYAGNADYLRRDVVGIPGGTGIGYLLTSNVNLTRNDDTRVIGEFDARFLDPALLRNLDTLEQHPVGVGVHPITAATIVLKGEFSLLKDGSCGGGFGRPGRIRPGS